MRLALQPKTTLRNGLVIAFRGIVDHARTATRKRDTARAIHDYRKSVRRARALLVMCKPLLSNGAYEELAGDLRDAHRLHSRLRDMDALLPVVQRLDAPKRLDRAKSAVAAELETQKKSIDPGLVEAMLVEGAARIEPVPNRLVEEFPNRVDMSAIVDGACDTYRRARAAMRAARKHGRDRDVHDWRKRTKEFTYQLELLTAGRRGATRKLQREFDAMTEELGAITDRMNLRDYVRSSAALRGDPAAQELAERVDAEAHQRMRRAFRRGEHAFRRKPRKFTSALFSLLK